MFKQLGGLAGLMKQMKGMSEMGGKMEAITARLEAERVHGSAGGEMVTVEANGLGVVLSVRIDPAIREEGDWEMAQDLLPAAINDATTKAKQRHADLMQELMGGFDLPGLEDAMKNLGLGS
jgi:DNA-binding YbaB/EbfC family protein